MTCINQLISYISSEQCLLLVIFLLVHPVKSQEAANSTEGIGLIEDMTTSGLSLEDAFSFGESNLTLSSEPVLEVEEVEGAGTEPAVHMDRGRDIPRNLTNTEESGQLEAVAEEVVARDQFQKQEQVVEREQVLKPQEVVDREQLPKQEAVAEEVVVREQFQPMGEIAEQVVVIEQFQQLETNVGLPPSRDPDFPSVDVTEQLINRTIFFEYLYPGWRGHWLAPANNYRAAVWPVIEDRIHDPAEGLRLFVRDCEEGFVCLRTRWLEEKYPNYFLHSGNHYFKYSTYPAGNEKLKWKIYCSSPNSTERCILCDKFYTAKSSSLSCAYIRTDGFVETEQVDEEPANWFLFRMVVPRAEVRGYEDIHEAAQSVCNDGAVSAVFEVQDCVGTTATELASWQISQTVTSEVSAGFQIDIFRAGTQVSQKREWGKAFSNSKVYNKQTCTKLIVTVPAHRKVGITHLYGTYGPYTIKTSDYHIKEVDC